jgi:hypothetical protein
MLLPEKGSDAAICDSHSWDAPKHWQRFWREAIRLLRAARPALVSEIKTDTRLARLIMDLRTSVNAQLTSDDGTLLQRLETQLSISGDQELRRLISVYLSEP